MQDQLAGLIKLQEMDNAVDDLHSKAETFIPLIQAKTKSIEDLKSGLKTTKEKLSVHQVRKKELELDADSKEKLVQKHQSELNSLKSNDAYKAMLGEIQAAKQAVVKIEDEILALMENIDSEEKAYKEIEKRFKTEESAVKAEIQSLEGKKNDLLSQAAQKKEERNNFAKTLTESLLSHYEIIREQRGGVAIAPLLDKKSCGGCRMGLTPAKVNEVVKGKELVFCDTCTRILYFPQKNLQPPSTPPPPSSSSEPASVS